MAEAPATDLLRDARRFAYENPRTDVQSMVPREARRILDLGCSSGALGAGLKATAPREIVGLELDPVYAERARTRLDRVEVAVGQRTVGGETVLAALPVGV